MNSILLTKPAKVQRNLWLCLLLCLISACTSRTAPAPVVNLSTKTATKQNLAIIEGDKYTVQTGDTLFAIAFYSGNDYRDLARFNNIPAPYHLNVGQTLRLTAPVAYAATKPKIDIPVPSTVPTPSLAPSVSASTSKPANFPQTNKPQSRNPEPVAKPRPHQTARPQPRYPPSTTNSPWIWPASGKHTVATVGSDGSKRGLDIKGELGSKIVAASAGKVVYAGNALKGYGNLVIIKHNEEFLSAYAHNQAILVSEQSYVKQGQQIATMGDSGASDVMLHFEIRKKGKSVDPFTYLPRK